MPPTPRRSPDQPLPVEKPRRRANLRAVPAGYDLDALPIHLPPHPGESVLSWTRRLAARYDVPVRVLLRHAGTQRRISSSRTIATRLRNRPGLVTRLGLTAEQTKPLINVQPLTAATTNYSATFGYPLPSQPQSRYCPRCLAEADPWWPDHWHSPLSWICPTHHTYLVNACPACGQPPHGQFAWIGHVIELHRCPSRRPTTSRAGHQRSHQWCNADLTTAPTTTAAPAAVAGQQLLHDWANDRPTTPVTVAGVDVTHRIAFQALVELIDAGTPGVDLLDLADDPAEMGPALADAGHVLTAADLSSAADRATMLTYDGPHAPVRPTYRLTNHRYSPLLAAIQLAGIREHLAPVDQMMFRTVHPAPRYPASHLTDRTQVRQLRLPEHNPRLPEPNPVWIPQTIWPLCVPEPLLGCTNHALRDSLLAMALLKIGNHDTWMKICQHLRLPATHPNRIGTYLRQAVSRGTWPAIHAALDDLMTLLQRQPPPIDYEHRRMVGRDTALLTEAVQAGRRQHPTDTDLLTLTQQFWERFTGGNIAYGPEELRLAPASPHYANLRRLNPLKHADLYHTAHNHLRDMGVADGPLRWTPSPAHQPSRAADQPPELTALQWSELFPAERRPLRDRPESSPERPFGEQA